MNIVILAAGKGKRMMSALPKVLHPLAGKPMLAHVIDTARQLKGEQGRMVVVIGHGAQQIEQACAASDIQFVLQAEQLGTGHAVMQAIPFLNDAVPTLVVCGDVPLTQLATLQNLVHTAGQHALGILTVVMPDPTGYGRIVRNEEQAIVRIVEQKDATDQERLITEVNTGIMVMPTPFLKHTLPQLNNQNAQGEYYLTDVVGAALANQLSIVAAQPTATYETLGVNSKVQLAQLERIYQANLAQQLMEQGVTLMDPARLDVRGTLKCGHDVTIDVNCVFEGQVSLGDGVHIGANCVIKQARIGAGSQIAPFTHIEAAHIGDHNVIGPFARLRPGTELGHDVHIGNFVEIKNSQIAAQSKANHLSYVGDASVGQRVNIGAGTITCNYDGANKHKTIIEDDAFIGSDSQLVAPVRVGKGATLGAGTTLTKDAPEHALTVSRAKQISLTGWQRPVKVKK